MFDFILLKHLFQGIENLQLYHLSSEKRNLFNG